MSTKYTPPRGTKDFLPEETYTAVSLENIARRIFYIYGYSEVRLPIIENKNIFIRSLGENSDVVEKQIFQVSSHEEICLRPEATAQIVRAYVENSLYLHRLVKFFYIGPMFRGERPQKGRFRQFHHIGAEALGEDSPLLDAEVIILAQELLTNFGIRKFDLELNSLGCQEDKEKFKVLIKEKLSHHLGLLCVNCQRRFSLNPLRILDCKEPSCKEIIDSLKIGHSYLCQNCLSRFKVLCDYLDNMGLSYKVMPTLVRGLDYYTQTVFEFTSPELGAQKAIGAGGRYDGLVKELGGPDKSGCGFALGLERVLILRDKETLPSLKVFFSYTSPDLIFEAFKLMTKLRKAGISSDMSFEFSSLKSQLRYAEKQGAEFVVIIGEEEFKDNQVVLKEMRISRQEKVNINNLVEILNNRLNPVQ